MSESEDSIVVRIAANISELVAGMQEAATVVQEGMEKIRTAIEVLSVAVLGGEIFEHLIEKTAETGVQLEILSAKTGDTVEHLSQLNYAANLSHVSAEELSISIQRLARNMEEATKSATTPTAEAFKALGITVTDSTGRLRPVTEVITQIAQKFSELQDGTGKTALAMDLFGRSGATLIPLLNQGAEGIQKLAAESDRLGNTWSKDDVEAAVKFEDATKRLGASWDGFVRTLVTAVFPVLEKLIQTLTALVHVVEAIGYAMLAATALTSLDFVTAAENATKAWNALKQVMHDFDSGETAPKTGGGAPPPLPTRGGPTQLDQWREEWNKRKEAALGGNADLLFLEIDFWHRKLQVTQQGTKEYIEIHSHLVDLETQLTKRSSEEETKHAKQLQQEWTAAFNAIPRAWNSAVSDWKKGGESMLDFWRDLMHSLVDEAIKASARMVIVHNAEWLERKKNILEGYAMEVAQSAWSMLKVVADYAVKAAAAAWSAMAGVPFIGPFLAPAMAAATLAGVLALASHGGGGGGGGGASSSAASASAVPSTSNGNTYNIYAMDADSFHKFAMKNAPTFAKASVEGAKSGVLIPGAAGRGG